MTFLAWSTIRRRAANMRLEVVCRRGHGVWIGPKEQNWPACPACWGWWRL